MHIQPNSRQLRSYLSPDRHFALMEQERGRSLTGNSLSEASEQQIAERIAALEALETTGFVYITEKNWLAAYQQQPAQFPAYHNYIAHLFSDFLQLTFQRTTEYEHLHYPIWSATRDMTGLELDFEALQHPEFLPIDELEIYVCGSEDGPSPAHLVKAFEFLHNLQYAMGTLPSVATAKRPLSVTGIDVCNPDDAAHWELNVISEYGADWDFTIVNGQAQRSS